MKNSTRLLGALGVLVLYFIGTTGCDPNAFGPAGESTSSVSVGTNSPTPNTIIMGSFNIQVFGRSKIGKSDVTNILVDVARRFDILAIQELRSTDQSIIPRFLEMINADGSKFRSVVGPRQGYTISTEQYVYIYDSEKIQLMGEPYVAPDPQGLIHRSPLVAHFRCLNLPPDQAFTFTLLNIHVDPDQVPTESAVLADVIARVRQTHPYEDDFILLGDVNSPPRFFQSYRWFDNQYPVVADEWQTKTAQNLNRDNIVFNAGNTREFLNQSGVMNLMLEYNLSVENALQVSDHLPVWAVFSAAEAQPARMVQEDPNVIR